MPSAIFGTQDLGGVICPFRVRDCKRYKSKLNLGEVGDAPRTGGLGSIRGCSDKLSGLYRPPHVEVVPDFTESTVLAPDSYRLPMGVGEHSLNEARGVRFGMRRSDTCVSQELVGWQCPEQIDSGVEEVDELFPRSVVGVTLGVEGVDAGSMR